MNTTANCTAHAFANQRLPWYVNGTLSQEERAAVTAHLETCANCREDLAQCEQMARIVRADGAVPIPPAASAADLLQRADRRGLRRLARNWRLAAVIACLSVAGALTLLPDSRTDAPNQQFSTVTGVSSLATVDYVFELRFAASVDDASRSRVLRELGGSAQRVEAGQGAYRVTLSLPPQSLADLDARAAAIAARSEVDAAEVVALQVPVR